MYSYLVDPNAHWAGEKEQEIGCFKRSLNRTAQRSFIPSPTFNGSGDSSKTTPRANCLPLLIRFTGKVSTTLANWLRAEQEKVITSSTARLSWNNRAASAYARSGSPFPGLRPFTPADAPVFFGRDREADFLVARLNDSRCRFLLVVGASGSGKSSLVAGGLLPRLAANAISGSEHWLLPDVHRVAQGLAWVGLRFTPGEQGEDPFQAIAGKLAPMLLDDVPQREVARLLYEDPTQLLFLVEQTLRDRPSSAQVLILIDQFEELVTIVKNDEFRTRFVDMLAAACGSSRIRVVAAVRADFYHRCIDAQPSSRNCSAKMALPFHLRCQARLRCFE